VDPGDRAGGPTRPVQPRTRPYRPGLHLGRGLPGAHAAATDTAGTDGVADLGILGLRRSGWWVAAVVDHGDMWSGRDAHAPRTALRRCLSCWGVTPRHRPGSPVPRPWCDWRVPCHRDQRQSGNFRREPDSRRPRCSSPPGPQPESIGRSPTVTAAAPSRPQTEPQPDTNKSSRSAECPAQLPPRRSEAQPHREGPEQCMLCCAAPSRRFPALASRPTPPVQT
ncbi:MAG: hypothetical protein QOC74_714, partial [Pseudonocardiales bacterium]|nr:hypothetical protein [Pseudonocardiales bacterium]